MIQKSIETEENEHILSEKVRRYLGKINVYLVHAGERIWEEFW